MIKETLKTRNQQWPDYKKTALLALLFACMAGHAQVKTDTKKPTPVFSAIRQPDAMVDIREKLVTLALQNPSYEIADRRVAVADFQVKKAKGAWLTSVAVQGNFNEYALKKNTTTTLPGGTVITNPSPYFPKYNFGISLPFNIISERKNDVKIAKENFSIAQAEKNQHFRDLKVQVLSKYEDYLLAQQRLDLQSQITQDAKTAYLASEKDFQEGAIKQDDYNKSYRAYTDEKIKQAEFVRNFNIIKLEMEAIIGTTMDDLLKK